MHRRAFAALALLVVVLIATAVVLVTRDEPVSPPLRPPENTTRTLLVQLRDPSLLALGAVLMGIDDEQRLSQLWWTADWWVDQIGVQEVSAAELGRKPVPYVMATVANQTAIRVDDAWVLDRLAFAGLVDAVGGVRLGVPRTTVYLTESGTPAVLPEGVLEVSGAQAADYVLDSSLKDEAERLRRFQAVWEQVVRRFPTDADKSRTLVVSLGALSKATMPTEELSAFMSDAHALRVIGATDQARLRLDLENSVRVRPAQGVRTAHALDPDRSARRVGEVFGGFPGPAQPVARVRAVTVRGQDVEAVRGQLLARSWQSAWGGRTVTASTMAIVESSVPKPDVVGLEQALGVTPAVAADLALAQAVVALPPQDELAVGL